MATRTMKVRPLERSMLTAIERQEPAKEGGQATYRFPVSSEEPVERQDWWTGETYIEVLSHEPDAPILGRARGGAVRNTHWGDQVGVSAKADVEQRRLYLDGVRFSRSSAGREFEQDVQDLIRQNVSIRYIPREVEIRKASKDGPEIRRWTKWEYVHTAFEPDPADPTVGVGRGREETQEFQINVRESDFRESDKPREKERAMPEELKQTAVVGEERAPAVAAATPAPKTTDRKAEIDEILAMAERNHIPTESVRDWLQRELTPDQVSTQVLALRATEVAKQPASEALINLTRKDAGRYRYRRAIAMAGGLMREAGLEKELHDELFRRYPQSRSKGGFLVPTRLLNDEESEDRALMANVAGKGAEFVQEGPLEFIDMLRNETICTRMGARLLPGLAAPIPFVRRTAGATVQWLGEGKTIVRSDGTFKILMLSGKRMGGAQQYSREMLMTPGIDTENVVKTDLVQGHAVAFDVAGLMGKGGSEPLGLYYTPGVQTVAMGAVPPSWVLLNQMPGKTATKNALFGQLGFITTPELAAVLKGTPKIAGGSAGFIWEGPLGKGELAGYPAAASNQAPSTLGNGTEHGIWFGPWQMMVFGAFGALELIVDPFTGKLDGLIECATHQLGDCVITMPEAFVLGTAAELS